nr:immunoglobulin heavy chain junction region [Mus musculus]MBK4197848.1 immunoglobulin heavy chain junction region [Mus musculus]
CTRSWDYYFDYW